LTAPAVYGVMKEVKACYIWIWMTVTGKNNRGKYCRRQGDRPRSYPYKANGRYSSDRRPGNFIWYIAPEGGGGESRSLPVECEFKGLPRYFNSEEEVTPAI